MEKEKVRIISKDGKTVKFVMPHIAADAGFLRRNNFIVADPKVSIEHIDSFYSGEVVAVFDNATPDIKSVEISNPDFESFPLLKLAQDKLNEKENIAIAKEPAKKGRPASKPTSKK